MNEYIQFIRDYHFLVATDFALIIATTVTIYKANKEERKIKK